MINFPFGTNGKSTILGVPILKHITVFNAPGAMCFIKGGRNYLEPEVK